MTERDEVASVSMDKPRWTEPLRPHAKRGMWAAGLLLIVAGAVSFYLFFLRPAGPSLTVVGGNPISIGDWPCGKHIATGITLQNDSGHDVVLDHMIVY